jgi:hypothetical protein
MANDATKFLSEIFSIPIGDMIASVGQGVATAQAALDDASIKATLEIYSTSGDEGLRLLRSIGYQPTFYSIPRASGKMSVALSMFSETTSAGSQLRLMASPMNPNISNKYGFTGSASAEVTFDIVPIPPNEQIRQVPNLVDMSAEQSALTLGELGLHAAFVDDERTVLERPLSRSVKAQFPAAGSIVKLDTEVTLTV